MGTFYLPSIGGQIEDTSDMPNQASPILNSYSPRLFGAPPQLTHLNDMRLMSSDISKDNIPGSVGDYYLTKVLQGAQVVNFVVGKALFTGGMSSIGDIIRTAAQYGYALKKYNVFDQNGNSVATQSTSQRVLQSANMETYKRAMNDTSSSGITLTTAGAAGLSDLDEDTSVLDINSLSGASSIISDLAASFGQAVGTLQASLLTSLSVNQPFYTFEADWNSYMQNVKMMINTAVIMLGLQKACVRIGDFYYPIGMNVNVKDNNDVWSNYRFITPTSGLGDRNIIDVQNGDNSQYVSFMIDPTSIQETYRNETGESQIYSSVINKGNDIGSEIAFITNSSANSVDDAVVALAGDVTAKAEKVLSNLTGGVGRFTAAIAGSMTRSYVGDHTIYPEIYKSSSATSEVNMTVKLRASSGDPYAYLTEILVPLFFIMGMTLPTMSKNASSAYTFPPLVQCNIPGYWGTRLGMVTSVQVTKNPDKKDVSVNGYPLAIDVTITVKDLQHVMMTSPMNRVSTFLNNHTMFDYIAQCAGVDKYRVNGSARLVTRLSLAAAAASNTFNSLGDAVMNDFTSYVNRKIGTFRF